MAKEQMFDDVVERVIAMGGTALFEGLHGIGKTELIRATTKSMGLELVTYSLAGLSYQDIIIPVPNHDTKGIGYYIHDQLLPMDKEYVLFLDEFNRCSVPTEQALLEPLATRTIMGRPLPKLRAIIAAINPVDDKKSGTQYGYNTRVLDTATKDRFHTFFQVTHDNVPWQDFLLDRYDQPMVPWLVWWRSLSEENKHWVTPRRIERAFQGVNGGINIEYLFPVPNLPLAKLTALLSGKDILTLEKLQKDADKYAAQLAGNNDPELAVQVTLIAKAIKKKDVATSISKPVQELPVQFRTALARAHRSRSNVLVGLFPEDD